MSRHIFLGNPSTANAYTLSLDCGVYTVTGNALTLTVQRTLSLDAGSYTVTGNALGLTAQRVLNLDLGTYTVTGNDVTLTYAPAGVYTLALDCGVYTVTGNAVSLTAQRKLDFDSGNYTITGNDVTFTYAPASGQIGSGGMGGLGVDVGRELRRRQREDEDKMLLQVIEQWLKKAA